MNENNAVPQNIIPIDDKAHLTFNRYASNLNVCFKRIQHFTTV